MEDWCERCKYNGFDVSIVCVTCKEMPVVDDPWGFELAEKFQLKESDDEH